MNQNQQAERLAQLYADAILRLSYTYLKKHRRCPGHLPDGFRKASESSPDIRYPGA